MKIMKPTIIVLLTLTVCIFDLAYTEEHNFTPKTVRLLYKKMYTALNNYQHMPQLNYTLCYRKNEQILAPKCDSDHLKKSFIEEMKNITKELDNTLKNANVSTLKSVESHFEAIEKSYEEIQQIINSDDRQYDEKMAEIEKSSKKWRMEVSNLTNGLNEFRGLISNNSNLQDINHIGQNLINILMKMCTKSELCFEKSFKERLMDFYEYMATVEVKIVVLTVHHNLLQDISQNDENVIREFKKIMRDSTLRTRDYMKAKEVLKKNLPPKKSLLNTGRKAKKTTKNRHVPARSKNANYTLLVNNNVGTRIVRKTNIAADRSPRKQNFIKKLSQIYKKIDGTWCENEPSYIRGVCDSIRRINQCVLKNNDRVSQKNTNLAMKNILQQWTNLLNEMSTFTSRKIDKYADIFKSIGLFEMTHYEKIDEIYNAASDLINSWNDELEGWKFQSLFALTQNFFYENRLQFVEFSDEIFHTSFHRCTKKSLLEQKLRTYCKSKSTSCSDELIKNQLYDIVEYLATIETKIFFSWTVHEVVQSMVIGDIFRTPNNHINKVNQLMENKNESFLRIKDYLNEIDDGHSTSPACEPISWKTRVRSISVRNRLPTPPGILNFAVKNRNTSVQMHLSNKMHSYFVKIQLNRTSIEISQSKNKKVEVGHFLAANRFNGYWIKWAEGKVSLGRAGESKPLIDITDVNTTVLSHFVISNANWILYDLPEQPGDGTNRETCWTAEIDRVGNEDGTVCRINHMGTWIPGTVSDNRCYLDYHSQVLPPTEDYQVFSGTNAQWMITSDKTMPKNAVMGGINKFGEPLYVCRSMDNTIVLREHCSSP